MPCSSDGYPPSEREMWEQRAVPAACEMARMLTEGQRDRLSSATRQWIKAHNKYDRESDMEHREENRISRIRRQALDKLSVAERSALGI